MLDQIYTDCFNNIAKLLDTRDLCRLAQSCRILRDRVYSAWEKASPTAHGDDVGIARAYALVHKKERLKVATILNDLSEIKRLAFQVYVYPEHYARHPVCYAKTPAAIKIFLEDPRFPLLPLFVTIKPQGESHDNSIAS